MKPKILPRSKNLPKEVMTNDTDNKHLIVGYVFLGLVFLGAVSAVYYWEYKANSAVVIQHIERQVESGEQSPNINGISCDLKPTMAKHKKTGELREFPSPCHVVDTWNIIK